MRRRTGIAAAVLTLFGVVVHAKVGRAPVLWMIQQSELVVVGTELAIVEVGEWKIAKVVVEEALLGSPPGTISVLASPTWTCDISDAEPGARVLLFLNRAERDFPQVKPPASHEGEAVYRIVHSGRGRMPITMEGGTELVTVWTSDVELPVEIETVPEPGEHGDWIRRVALDDLRHLLVSPPDPASAKP